MSHRFTPGKKEKILKTLQKVQRAMDQERQHLTEKPLDYEDRPPHAMSSEEWNQFRDNLYRDPIWVERMHKKQRDADQFFIRRNLGDFLEPFEKLWRKEPMAGLPKPVYHLRSDADYAHLEEYRSEFVNKFGPGPGRGSRWSPNLVFSPQAAAAAAAPAAAPTEAQIAAAAPASQPQKQTPNK